MSGLEHYRRELAELDHEIRHWAAVCRINPDDRGDLLACLAEHHADWADDRARQSLYGLLQLRLRIETEMIELGETVPELRLLPAADTPR